MDPSLLSMYAEDILLFNLINGPEDYHSLETEINATHKSTS